jgi:hypothetical protein
LQKLVTHKVNVLGEANSNATVTLRTQDAGGTPGQPGDPPGFFRTIRKNDYFRGEVSFNNSTGAVWMSITNIAVLTNGTCPDIIVTNTGGAYAAKTAELFQYDALYLNLSPGLLAICCGKCINLG